MRLLRRNFEFEPISGVLFPLLRYIDGHSYVPDINDIWDPRQGADDESDWDQRLLGRAMKDTFLYREISGNKIICSETAKGFWMTNRQRNWGISCSLTAN
jgi:hypothetical protein